MGRSGGRKTYSFGIRPDLLKKLKQLATEIGDQVGDPNQSYGDLVGRAAQYLLTIELKEVVRIIKIGMTLDEQSQKDNPGRPSFTKSAGPKPIPRKIKGRPVRGSNGHDAIAEVDHEPLLGVLDPG